MSAPSWLTGKADAASLASLVEKLGTQIDITTVDELFVFPMRRVAGVESTVFVLSMHDHADTRRVVTAHVRAVRNKRGEPAIETKLDDQAIVPPERIPRVIEGVLRRLKENFATPPSTASIARSPERWAQLVEMCMSIKANDPLPEVLVAPEASPGGVTELRDVEASQEEVTGLRDVEEQEQNDLVD